MMLEEQSRIICTWMEPQPEVTPEDREDALGLMLAGSAKTSPGGWWQCVCIYEKSDIPIWLPCWIGLEKLHVAEKVLTQDQRDAYVKTLLWDTVNPQGKRIVRDTFGLINASAVHKLAALASVLNEVK